MLTNTWSVLQREHLHIIAFTEKKYILRICSHAEQSENYHPELVGRAGLAGWLARLHMHFISLKATIERFYCEELYANQHMIGFTESISTSSMKVATPYSSYPSYSLIWNGYFLRRK